MPQPATAKHYRKLLLWTMIPLAILAVGAISFAGYKYYQDRHVKGSTAASSQQAKATDPYAGWKTYTDDATTPPSGISIKYPSDWQVNTTGTKSYGWSITSATASITVNDLFLDPSKAARQGWEFCAGTDACPGTSADDKTVSSSESSINGFNAYTAAIQSSNGTYHVTVIRGNTQSDGTAPYVMFTTYSTDQATLSTFAKIMASATFKSDASSVDPYAGWKTYTSQTEKLSFKYPSAWSATQSSDSTQVDGADSLTLKSPTGAVSVQWYSSVEGIGGACSTYIMPGTTPKPDDLGPCPYFYVLDKQKLTGANLYYVDGVVEQSDGKTYQAWCGLQASDGIIQNESNIGYMLFTAKNTFAGTNNANTSGPYQAELACGGGFGGTIGSLGTKAQATAFLATPEMQQAKLILLSASY